jgi:uncharacterized protein (TIGR00730 family)
MKISVFGGASPKPGEEAYEEARELGFMLGSHGHTLLTGGYIGVMEAVSKGANESGAHVIASTCQEIENLRGARVNRWTKEEWHFETLRERMYALIDKCDAAIALPGGIGTLAELSVMWNESIISQRPSRPLILVGQGWQSMIESLVNTNGKYISVIDQKRVTLVKDVLEAVQLIDQLNAEKAIL